jgi:hypothetical protein
MKNKKAFVVLQTGEHSGMAHILVVTLSHMAAIGACINAIKQANIGTNKEWPTKESFKAELKELGARKFWHKHKVYAGCRLHIHEKDITISIEPKCKCGGKCGK